MSERLFNDNWSFMLKEVGSELSDALAEQEWHDQHAQNAPEYAGDPEARKA